jgi:cell wall-associated NlpC family hydrolase
MKKVLIEAKTRSLVILIIVFQLLNTYCSRQHYPVSSFHNIGGHSEEKKLKSFLDAGTERKVDTHDASADEIITTAQNYLGVPHCMGGTTMKCIDCSGLVLAVFAKHGILLPHNSQDQARYGKIISGTDKLRKGDLVFFVRSYKTRQLITHSGIFIGNNQFIHTSSKKGVTITSMNDQYWKEKFIFGTRLIE